MRRRARWLLLLNFFIPGSAQLVSGSKRLARLGLIVTLFWWVAIIALVATVLLDRVVAIGTLTNAQGLQAAGWTMIGFGIVFAILSLDTIRLVRIGHTGPKARWVYLVAFLLVGLLPAVGLVSTASFATRAGTVLTKVFRNSGTMTDHKGRFDILLLGGDSGSDRFGLRPDSISVLSINATTGAIVNIGIPRNLQHAPFPVGTPMHKHYPAGYWDNAGNLINAIYKDVTDNFAYEYPKAKARHSTPGVEATKEAVEGVTGLKIDYYILIDMKSFAKLVNALGGLEMTVKHCLPIGGYVRSHQDCLPMNGQRDDLSDVVEWLHPGKQHLDGYHALWYARSRHGSTDYARMQRQREVENALLAQVNIVNILTKFDAIAAAGESLLKTNIPKESVATLVDLAIKARAKKGIKSLELGPPTYQPDSPNFPFMHKSVKSVLAKSK
jgi:LCP family protein required for cell wall assembly